MTRGKGKYVTPGSVSSRTIGHGWPECRAMLPTSVRLVAARLVELGAFATAG